jgi:hypothetical protein
LKFATSPTAFGAVPPSQFAPLLQFPLPSTFQVTVAPGACTLHIAKKASNAAETGFWERFRRKLSQGATGWGFILIDLTGWQVGEERETTSGRVYSASRLFLGNS